MALKITITNHEDVNKAVVKIYIGEEGRLIEDFIKPKESKEYHLYGHDCLKISQK